MSPVPIRIVRFSAALALALTIQSGCSDNRPSTDAATDTTEASADNQPASGTTYVAHSPAADGWQLQEAINLPPDDSRADLGEPSLDWYAEYVNDPNSTELVTVSGHAVGLEDLRNEPLMSLWDFQPETAGEWAVLAAPTPPEDPNGPAIVIFEAGGEYSFQVLSYELGVDRLLDWTADIEPLSEDEWVAAGGVLDEWRRRQAVDSRG